MNEERILAAIGEVKDQVAGRMDKFEDRLSEVEKIFGRFSDVASELKAHQAKQREDIDVLFRRVDELCRGPSAIWHSRDGREVGLEIGDVYDTFRELGYGRREALKLIDLAGRLSRPKGKHYSKPIRLGDGIRRAIVIFEKE